MQKKDITPTKDDFHKCYGDSTSSMMKKWFTERIFGNFSEQIGYNFIVLHGFSSKNCLKLSFTSDLGSYEGE